MLKTLFTACFLIVLFSGCLDDHALNPGHSEQKIPAWLQERISEISTDQSYSYSEVYRYEWEEKNVYHILVPTRSCIFCELYSENGNVLNLSDEEFFDFVEHKKDEILLWKWRDD